jgi:hypothetical protein
MNQPNNKFAVLFVLCLFSFLPSCGIQMAVSPGKTSLVVRAVPIHLDPSESDRKTFGRLAFLAGFELSSKDSRFGGLSGLTLRNDGRTLYAVSDHGYWLSARILHDETGRLVGVGSWEIAPLLTPQGIPVTGRQRDAEALERDRDGSFLVSFERDHRLWRYSPSPALFDTLPEPVPTPTDLAKAPNNGGLEGMTVLPDGRFLLLTEQYENSDGSFKGWIVEDGRFEPISYMTSDGFHPTDLSTLAGGDVLVLERRYGWFRGAAVRIRRLPHSSLRPGTRLQGEEIARFERPLAVDNFEGIAVREDPRLGTLVYLISDDNYSPFQRTLLLQFRLNTASGN